MRYVSGEITIRKVWECSCKKLPEERVSLRTDGKILRIVKICSKMPKSTVFKVCDLYKIKNAEGS